MGKATQTMIENLHKNTGKTLDQWIALVNAQNFKKHGEAMKFLKEERGLSHGFANLVAHKSKEAKSGGAQSEGELIADQYKGKEHFKEVYKILTEFVRSLGSDVDFAPKKSYVSLKRKKQFATLKPATKSRFEIGLNLKDYEADELLVAEKANAMCSHKICLEREKDINDRVYEWIKTAYQKAG